MRIWKTALLLIWLLQGGALCLASDVILQWDPNTEPDLRGYRVYYKANSSEFPFDGAGAIEGASPIDVANLTTATITGLDPATDYSFAVTAYNTSGMESPYSEIITIPAVKDTTPPAVSFASPMGGATVRGAVEITATASDDTEVRRVELYQNDLLIAAGNTVPLSHMWDTSALPDGSFTLTARAFDAAGNAGTASVAVSVVNDTSAPEIQEFLIPASAISLSVPVTFVATDNVRVDGYLVAESSAMPAATDPRWSASAPTAFTFAGYGPHTLYAWAKDAAGNVSAGKGASILVTAPDTTAPAIVSFSMPSAAPSTTVEVSRLEASDDNYVTGFLVSESSTAPAPGSGAWTSSAPTSFTFAGSGTRTAYAWAKDAAGNVSAAVSCTVVVDMLPPVVTGPSVTVSGTAATIVASAKDNVAVAKMQLYLDDSLLLQSLNDAISYQVKIGKGRHRITVKAFDAVGNVATGSILVTR